MYWCVVDRNKIEDIKKTYTIYEKKDFEKIPDKDIKEMSKNFDRVYIINNIDDIIENSSLKTELEKIKKLEVAFNQENDYKVQQSDIIEKDDLMETNDKEILNRPFVLNLKRRGLKPKLGDNIFLKNKEDRDYKKIKGYVLNISLSYEYNDDFDKITKLLKMAIPNNKEEFSVIKPCILTTYRKIKTLFFFPEIVFNNETYGKNVKKLFTPNFVKLAVDLEGIRTNDFQNLKVSTLENENVINLWDYI